MGPLNGEEEEAIESPFEFPDVFTEGFGEESDDFRVEIVDVQAVRLDPHFQDFLAGFLFWLFDG